MKKRNKNKFSGRLQVAIFLAIAAAASSQSLNSCSETTASVPSDEPEIPVVNVDPSNRKSHYPGLETVTLPENLASQIKEYIGFTISFNKDTRTPNYVAWELLGTETTGEHQRTDKFWTDPDLVGCPSTKDYTNSGYDRGHMCPAADQKWSAQAMEDCFVMANICPQLHSLNAGAWATLESKERQWAARDSAVMIISGPIYNEQDIKRIGSAGVKVPGAFFKVLAAPYLDEPRGIAFVYPNMDSPGNMQDYAMSIRDLEKILKYDFFPALPDDVEDLIETKYSFKEWNNSK